MQNTYVQEKLNYNYFKQCVRNRMLDYGFDFSLTGTKYIYELLYECVGNIECFFEHLQPTMRSLADKYNIKLKSLNRDIRWSIEKNENIYNKNISLSVEDDISTTKDILIWLCDFFNFF